MPAQASPAGRFVPFRQFDKIENLPNWRDVAPRLGAVYDLMGDGRTAIKVHVGKYMQAFSTVGFAAVYNPMVIATDRRTWTDPNGDDIAQNNEIGPVNMPFNVSGVSNRTPDPDIKRPVSVGVRASASSGKSLPGISVSADWVRRDFKRHLLDRQHPGVDSDYTVVNIPNPAPGELRRRSRGRFRSTTSIRPSAAWSSRSTRTPTSTGGRTTASTSASPPESRAATSTAARASAGS